MVAEKLATNNSLHWVSKFARFKAVEPTCIHNPLSLLNQENPENCKVKKKKRLNTLLVPNVYPNCMFGL